ncbi:glycosyltransferase family 9 protein [uncultured Fusobacterium sp.]|uniref:glycosyltransferase family 9 protein n=1 Tax=uncultured Fusobacterium sp. TaxID=159267 RepID=UPI00261A8DCE|nr:glycosyltransferase family 9 protein [uncultured Fusobacterium sp.]
MKEKISSLAKIFLYYFDLVSLKFFLINKKEKRDIIIIRTDGIGDFILWINSAERLRRFYKDKKITLITTNENRELAELINCFDEIICINRKKFTKKIIYRFKVLKFLTQIESNTLINPIVSHSSLSEAIALAIKGSEKVGIESRKVSNLPSYLEKVILKKYTKLVKIPNSLEHEIEKNFFFTNRITGEDQKIYLSNKCLEKIKNYTKQSEKYYLFFIGASDLKRCLEVLKFVKLANELIEKGKKIILCGGKNEEELGEKFLRGITKKENVNNLIGKTNIREIISLVKNAEKVISNETFSSHLAKLLDKKLILFLGGGHYGRFFPYPKTIQGDEEVIIKKMDCFNCNWKCRYREIPYKCIKDIKIEEVII